MFAFNLLQIDIFHTILSKYLSNFRHCKILTGLILQEGSTGEIHSHICFASGDLDKGNEADGNENGRYAIGDIFEFQIIQIRLFGKPKEGQFFHRFYCVKRVKYSAGVKQRREQVKDNTQRESNGETLDWPCTKHEKSERGDQGCYLGIYDCQKRFSKTAVNTRSHRFAKCVLLPHPLKNKDVCVNCHPDGEDNTRNTGKGQSRIENRKTGKEKQNVQDQCAVGDYPACPVIDYHEAEHQYSAKNT